jgi:hypothetical protein
VIDDLQTPQKLAPDAAAVDVDNDVAVDTADQRIELAAYTLAAYALAAASCVVAEVVVLGSIVDDDVPDVDAAMTGVDEGPALMMHHVLALTQVVAH